MDILRYDFIDINTLSLENINRSIELMSDRQRQRILNFAREDDRLRSIAAEHIARNMILQTFNVSEEEITFDRLPSGQPVVNDLPLHISFSHSGRWAMCAIGSTPIGADVEIISDRGKRIVSKICSAEEQAYIFSSGEFDSEKFMLIWTAKEAVLKRTGKGLSGGISTVIVADRQGLFNRINDCSLISDIHHDAAFAVYY